MSSSPRNYNISASLYMTFIVVFLATLPGLYFGLFHVEHSPVAGVLLFGIAIFGAAFILSWAAEVAQMDISESLAVAA